MHNRQNGGKTTIHTLDLDFQGVPKTIASYLIPHEHGAILIESGPGSTIKGLRAGLRQHGFTEADVTDVLLTHIHLDHAGAAGWLAQQGARIHVHPVGAPHLIDPEKLLTSAARIYGDMMEPLWGEFLPVPEEKIAIVEDGDEIEIGGVCIKAIDTPGHANHHHAYLFEDTLFTGDIGGVRLPGPRHLRLPMPPPEFQLEKWRESVEKISKERFTRIAPTHFGIYEDAEWHIEALKRAMDEVESWMEAVMPAEPSLPELNNQFQDWSRERSLSQGVTPEEIEAYETANPTWMSPLGIQRYWQKYRQPVKK